MSATEAVVIGGSLGSLQAVMPILSLLPHQARAAVIVVMHQHRHGTNSLADVLQRSSPLPTRLVVDKAAASPGVVHVCPANYHLLVERERTFALSADAPVNYSRPSIDVTFESAAVVYRGALAGVLLSGANNDGARGLMAIKARGGVVACQEPETAQAGDMPSAGMVATAVDHVGAPTEIAEWLSRLLAAGGRHE